MEPPGRAPTKQRRRERILVEPQQPPAVRVSKPRGVASTKTPENCQPAARSSKTVPTARTRHQGCRHRPSGRTGARVFTRRSSEKEQDGTSREDCGAKGVAVVSPRASKAFAKNSFTPRCESNGTGASEPSTSPAPGIGRPAWPTTWGRLAAADAGQAVQAAAREEAAVTDHLRSHPSPEKYGKIDQREIWNDWIHLGWKSYGRGLKHGY